jgi:hypothetical protein
LPWRDRGGDRRQPQDEDRREPGGPHRRVASG